MAAAGSVGQVDRSGRSVVLRPSRTTPHLRARSPRCPKNHKRRRRSVSLGQSGVGAYGGSNRTSGDTAAIGSHDLYASTFGVIGGFDYRLTPETVVGLAFGYGGSNWSVTQGLGGGKSSGFQAGLYGSTQYGPAYLGAAFAFANHWMSTDRFSVVGDRLTGDFDGQSYGGRLEGGYRFKTSYGGITPYAAIQAQSFHTPGYTETGVISNSFALTFNGRDAHRYQDRVGRALRPGAGGLFQCGAGAARARRLGARLVQRSDTDADVPGASRRELRCQRRGAAAELRAGIGRRGASLRQRDHVTRQVRWRVRIRLVDRRRNGDFPIQLVRADTQPSGLRLQRPLGVNSVGFTRPELGPLCSAFRAQFGSCAKSKKGHFGPDAKSYLRPKRAHKRTPSKP